MFHKLSKPKLISAFSDENKRVKGQITLVVDDHRVNKFLELGLTVNAYIF